MKKKAMLVGLITVLSVGIYTSYKQENKAKEVEYDSNTMAVYVKDNNGIYQKESSFPTSGYKLNNEKSVCTNGVTLVWSDNSLKLNNLTNTTSCYLYFDEMVAKDQILTNKTIETRTDFSTALTENTTGKIYTAEDNDGTSYYYAGAVDNNWVKFGGFYWRIIRINGDGTLRMIYNGTSTAQTGTTTQINGTTYAFNSSYNDNAYVGYMYGTTTSSTYAATHQNTNDSYAKQIIDSWYNTNLNKEGIKEHIDINAGFCGDRSVVTTYGTGLGYGTNETYYQGYNRLNNKAPLLKCTNSDNDLYTVSSSNKGNRALTYPVGLITADEIIYAVGTTTGSTQVSNYYLYTNQTYWTMTPYYQTSNARIFGMSSSGIVNYIRTDSAVGLRPVINLKDDTVLTGNGTTSSPYEVVG